MYLCEILSHDELWEMKRLLLLSEHDGNLRFAAEALVSNGIILGRAEEVHGTQVIRGIKAKEVMKLWQVNE